jgi:hypothetical protein
VTTRGLFRSKRWTDQSPVSETELAPDNRHQSLVGHRLRYKKSSRTAHVSGGLAAFHCPCGHIVVLSLRCWAQCAPLARSKFHTFLKLAGIIKLKKDLIPLHRGTVRFTSELVGGTSFDYPPFDSQTARGRAEKLASSRLPQLVAKTRSRCDITEEERRLISRRTKAAGGQESAGREAGRLYRREHPEL